MGHNRGVARRSVVVAVAAMLVFALAQLGWASPPAHAAAAGDLDATFGSGGKVRTDLGLAEVGNSAAITSDGRIVVAGRQTDTAKGVSRILVARYLANGTLDPSFGQGGVVTDVVGKNPTSFALAVAIQPDGKVVVAGSTTAAAGSTNNDVAVVRYLANGSRDATFGSGGVATFDAGNGGSDSANAIAVLADGRLALAVDAPAAATEWTLVIVSADGTTHTATNGFPAPSSPTAIAVTPDGKIAVAGYAQAASSTPDIAFARYDTNGRLDTTFGSKGFATVDFTGGDDEAFGMAVAGDGSLFASGFTTLPAGTTAGAVVKVTAAGVPDATFGRNGRVTIDFGTALTGVGSVVLQRDGSVVVAGSAGDRTTRRFALARLTAVGALDASFGQAGKVITEFTGQEAASAVRLTPAGSLLAAGFTGAPATSDLALAQYRTTATTTVTTTSTTAAVTTTTTKTATPPSTVTGSATGSGSTTTTAPPGEEGSTTAPPPAGETGDGSGGAAATSPQLVISSPKASIGGRVKATALQVPAGSCPKVFFLVDGRTAASAVPDAANEASADLRFGDGFAPGRHRVAAACSARASNAFAATTVSVSGTLRSAFVRAVPAPGGLSTDARVLAANALLALIVVLLVAFPAELFNSTLDANYDEVTGWFAPWRRRARSAGAAPAAPAGPWRSRLQLAAFLVAGTVIYGLLDPHFGLNRPSVALALGLLVGLLVVTVTFGAARSLYMRRRFGERGHFACRPASIVVAIVCVLISRLLHFEPGYLFGLIGGYVVERELPRDDEGAITAIGAVVILVVGALAWIVWVPVSHHAARAGSSLGLMTADAALAAVFVASIEALAIGLLPLRFLNGARVIEWNRAAWAVLFGVSVFIFVHALLHPQDGYASTSPRASVFAVVALAAAFGLGSVAFWSYFRFRRPRTETRVV